MRGIFYTLFIFCLTRFAVAQDWKDIPVPAEPGTDVEWIVQEQSDDFNYAFEPSSNKTNFGDDKWYNFFHNSWNGPGTTYWQYDHVEVDGNDLIIRASRNTSTSKMGVPGVNAGCITSNERVLYPVFVEASVSVANITLASDVWLLSPDDTQEIDIIECYGGAENGNSYFAQFIHLSHHSFIRSPFTDYQPRDSKSWYSQTGVSSWGDYCWNNGDRKYVRVAVYWKSPVHFEYYIDGNMVRVLHDKALAYKQNNKWYYAYPTMTNGTLDFDGGYQRLTQYKSSNEYSYSILIEASNKSTVSIIDPYGYQNGEGFTKEQDIIINVESQDWHVDAGRTPTDEELADSSRNIFKVDWIRVCKPDREVDAVKSTHVKALGLVPNPVQQSFRIESDSPVDELLICRLNGALQKKVSIKNQQQNISTEGIVSGIYIVKARHFDGSWSSQRLLKL